MFTNNLTKIVDKRKKRVGRGPGSGKGSHTVGKGQKGQTSRGGYHGRRGMGSAEFSVLFTYPKQRGNSSPKTEKTTVVRITKLLEKGVYDINSEVMAKFSSSENIKLVGDTAYDNFDLGKVVVRSGISISNSLKQMILQKGGSVEE